MSFLSAAFLFGLPLLAVPVAIHLLNRRHQEVVKWAAMQFLMDSRITRRKIWRLDDLILMLLRALSVLGIVLALARPMWHHSGMIGGMGRDVVFVWDVSMSMERKIDGQHSSFDRMVEKTNELLSQLGPRDTVRGIVTIGRGKWLSAESNPATPDQKRFLVNELNKVGVTQSSADWIACLGTALRVAPPRAAKAKLVAVISDGQAHGWRQHDPSGWQNLVRLTEESRTPVAIEMYNICSSPPPPQNLAVERLITPRQLVGIGETVLVNAEVRNYGQSAVQVVSTEWSINGETLGKASFGPIAPGQSRLVPFKTTMAKAGLSQLKCRIEVQDNLESDNEQTLILETVENVPLLLVDNSSETDPLKTDRGYLLAAVGHNPNGEINAKNSGVFRITTIKSAELAGHSLSNFRAVLFANTPDLDEPSVAKLMDFVRVGGGLWLALGDQTHADDFNQKFYKTGGGLSPWPVDNAKGDLVQREHFLSIHPPDKEHPATALLSDTQRLDIDRVKVFQRFPFAAAPAKIKVPVLLQSGTGEPLAIEGFLGRGRVIVQSMPMGVQWSNLPLTQAYVPLVHEWLWHLVQPTAISRNLQPGEPLQALLPRNEHVRELRVKCPDGSSLSMEIYQRGDQTIAQSRATFQPGQYEVVLKIEGKDDQTWQYQVIRSAEESNLDPWPQELIARWSGPPSLRLNPSSIMEMPLGTSGHQRPGEPLWTMLLALVVFAFLTEMWLVRRIAKKRFAGNSDSSNPQSVADRLMKQTLSLGGTP